MRHTIIVVRSDGLSNTTEFSGYAGEMSALHWFNQNKHGRIQAAFWFEEGTLRQHYLKIETPRD